MTAVCFGLASAAGGFTGCARLADATVQCWGGNPNGQLGLGVVDKDADLSPMPVVGLTAVAQLAAGTEYACARIASGAVACWGANDRGQLGDGTTTDRATPTMVRGLSNVTEIALGSATSCARLGDGTTNPRQVPAPVVW